MVFPDVTHVRYLGGHRLELAFADGVVGQIDLANVILGKGGVFAPLEDPTYFAKVAVNADIGTIVWPNDVDLDPEVLYGLVTGKTISNPMSRAG